MQVAFFEWLAMTPYASPLIFHVPNGGFRPGNSGYQMKRQGVKAGVSDIIALYPRGGYHGLIIELKFGSGKVTPEQNNFLTLADGQDYCTKVIWDDWLLARDFFLKYMNGLIKVEAPSFIS